QRPLVIFAGHAPAHNYAANTYPFRAASNYLYFGGPPLEHAALCIEPESDGAAGCTLLRPVAGPDDVLWTGAPPDDADLATAAGLPESALAPPERLAALVSRRATAGIVPLRPGAMAQAAELKLAAPIAEELQAIIDLRLIKDDHELAALRFAAQVSMDAHRAALGAAMPGGREADAAADFASVLVANDCRPAFTPIITVRGEVLHGAGYGNTLLEGALLLVDAGAEEPGGYASDITRTVPIGGRWSAPQRQLYEIVLRANQAATAACRPGRRFREVHYLTARAIAAGLADAGLLRGQPDEIVARNAHALFFPHGLGHLIGLDVHDMEDFGDLAGYAPGRSRPAEFGAKFLRLDRDLAPGMCVTIEPGIYLVPTIWQRADLVGPVADLVNRDAVDELLEDNFGGIRIEHTVCVRDADGPEVLTADLPTDADRVAELVPQA
ncbi:MAG: aminopeptidase P N-terminal domain-containing protein, partial [Planctomycetota bacterium]